MIRNDEQFKQYFYYYLLFIKDIINNDYVVSTKLEYCLKNYLMFYGYFGCHDLDELLRLYYEKGRI